MAKKTKQPDTIIRRGAVYIEDQEYIFEILRSEDGELKVVIYLDQIVQKDVTRNETRMVPEETPVYGDKKDKNGKVIMRKDKNGKKVALQEIVGITRAIIPQEIPVTSKETVRERSKFGTFTIYAAPRKREARIMVNAYLAKKLK